MADFVGSIAWFFWQCAIDFITFIIVDSFAKIVMGDSSIQEDRQLVWFWESIVLTAMCILLYFCHHTPLLLLCLTIVTFLCSQFGASINLRQWWLQLVAKWREHLEHQESVNHLLKLQSHLPPRAQETINMTNKQQYQFKPPTCTTSHVVTQQATFNDSQRMWSNNYTNTQHYMPINRAETTMDKHVATTTSEWRKNNSGDTYLRRPIRFARKMSPLQSMASSAGNNLKEKFISTFKLSPQADGLPPGMHNQGQNICFMNCVLQCLARTPGLVKRLQQDSKKCQSPSGQVLKAFLQVMEHCCGSQLGIVNVDHLRWVLSEVPQSMVASPKHHQMQQDAGEFLLWLLDQLHEELNSLGEASDNAKVKEKIKTLKFIYGDLSKDKVQQLRQACLEEISAAHGLQNDSYAEPVQRLSDVEWLTYKDTNRSIIDNTFTGQMVIGCHCLMDNRIAVKMQPFRMLPVPITDPREISGLVMLRDCFTKFCSLEQLSGENGLNHDAWCPAANNDNFTPIRRKTRASSADSGVGDLQSPCQVNHLSPIPSLTHDCHVFSDKTPFKTSTPIHGDTQSHLQANRQKFSSVQQRCLLRHLPTILGIQLMRFTFNQFTHTPMKIRSPVSIPLKGLDLTDVLFDTVTNRTDLSAQMSSNKYDLYALCLHLGAESTNFGHYVCYCQGEDKQWYKFDDEIVTMVNMEYELTLKEVRENAYILFYKLRD